GFGVQLSELPNLEPLNLNRFNPSTLNGERGTFEPKSLNVELGTSWVYGSTPHVAASIQFYRRGNF
ncbi:MAG: hypothetical protein WBM78_20130, partial [Desulfobacterales bacterium]